MIDEKVEEINIREHFRERTGCLQITGPTRALSEKSVFLKIGSWRSNERKHFT